MSQTDGESVGLGNDRRLLAMSSLSLWGEGYNDTLLDEPAVAPRVSRETVRRVLLRPSGEKVPEGRMRGGIRK